MQDFDDDNARMGFDEVNSNADTIEFDYQTIRNSRRAAEEVIDDDGDDDVTYVRNYQRPDDERAPSNDAGNIRAVEAEDRAARAEEMLAERVHRTSCPVCTDDLLTSATIRYPCGHLSCLNCARRIEQINMFAHVPENRCPTCRENFGSWRNCLNVFFHNQIEFIICLMIITTANFQFFQ